MKKNMKRWMAALLAAAMAFALTACGGSGNNGDGAKSSAPAALTADEYKDAFEELFSDMGSIQSVDVADEEAAKATLEDMKDAMNQFIALNPPESCEEGHAKMASGCQAMVDYIDAMLSIVGETDEQKITDATADAVESFQTAMTDMTEGATLLDEVFAE